MESPLTTAISQYVYSIIAFHGVLTPHCFTQADLIRTVTLPHLQLFGVSEGLELRVREGSVSFLMFLITTRL